MTTSAEELKRALQTRQIDNLAPKPFGSHSTSFKGRSITSNGTTQTQGVGPQLLTSNDLLKHKLKPVSSSNSVGNEEKPDESNVPEFLKQRLKSPAERKAAAAQKDNAQKTISNALAKKPLAPQKPTIKPKVFSKPPYKEEKKDIVSSEKSNNSDNNDENDGITKIRSGSVRNSVNFFKEIDQQAHPNPPPKAPVKPPIKPKFNIVKDQPVGVQEKQEELIEEENYDDVAEIINKQPDHKSVVQESVETAGSNNCEEECYYDDVDPDSFPQYNPQRPCEQSASELYDDVCNDDNNDEIYDDVCEPASKPLSSVNTAARTSELQQETKSDFTPVKLPKTFSYIDPDKLIPPFGLDKWLKTILLSNQSKLKDFANFPTQGSNDTAVEMIPTEDDEITDEIYDDVAGPAAPVKEVSDSPKLDSKSAKERKKEEKEKADREKREKREKEKKEKKEKEEKEKEKKRREKEYKQFNLNPDLALPLIGTVMCKVDYKPRGKTDLTYQIGDEINIINVPNESCPNGKMLVQHCGTGRIGYVLRQDFGMELPPEDPRSRSVSLIPTEDDLEEVQETYEEINVHQAPPVPETPRPYLRPEAPIEEDLYNDIADEPAEDIYEEI